MPKQDLKPIITFTPSTDAIYLQAETPDQHNSLLKWQDRKNVERVITGLLDAGSAVYLTGSVVTSTLQRKGLLGTRAYGDIDLVAVDEDTLNFLGSDVDRSLYQTAMMQRANPEVLKDFNRQRREKSQPEYSTSSMFDTDSMRFQVKETGTLKLDRQEMHETYVNLSEGRRYSIERSNGLFRAMQSPIDLTVTTRAAVDRYSRISESLREK